MKIDNCGTMCERCDNKIKWWQSCFFTSDERWLHVGCFNDEVMTDNNDKIIKNDWAMGGDTKKEVNTVPANMKGYKRIV